MATKRGTAKTEPALEPKQRVFETFKRFGSYELSNLRQENPSCWNGQVSVKRYRVTKHERKPLPSGMG